MLVTAFSLLAMLGMGCTASRQAVGSDGQRLLIRSLTKPLADDHAHADRLIAQARGLPALTSAPHHAKAETSPFSYDLYCDPQGRFTYDGAALALLKEPTHLRQIYQDARRGEARAGELVRELEQVFSEAGVQSANLTGAPRCLLLPELTPDCTPNWKFFDEFLGNGPEAAHLTEVFSDAYQNRARKLGLRNEVIAATVNLLFATSVASEMAAKPASMLRGIASESATVREVEASTSAGRGGRQFRGPDPASEGPHSRFRADEKGVTHYETYDHPAAGQGKRVDVVGPSHGGMPTPHVVETRKHVNPKDPTKFRYSESRPRPAEPEEIPQRRP